MPNPHKMTCFPPFRMFCFRGACRLLIWCFFAVQTTRIEAATYTVSSTNDSGAGSLRQAILSANGASGSNTIVFDISPGPYTITPASALPAVTSSVLIDGTSQPGYAGTPVIEINGSQIGAGNDGLVLTNGGSTVLGLAINRCPGNGIRLAAPGTNVLRGNFLGTDVTGTIARGNGAGGIMISGSSGNWIGGPYATNRNLISGGNSNGVYILSGSAGNVMEGNYIGVSATGMAGLGNAQNGIEIAGAWGNIIGGTVTGAGNVVSGNGQDGIYIFQAGTTSNLVEGNYIGVNATGAGAVSNAENGVTINSAAWNTVGGTAAGAGNIISGNGNAGVFIYTTGATNNLVLGNFIGTDLTGKAAVANQTNGVVVNGGSGAVPGNMIGGSGAAARNVISGNHQNGVLIVSAGASNNWVQGNYIGVDVTGTNALPNTMGGVEIDAAAGCLIGGASAGNVISGNSANGVFLVDVGGGSNLVQGNLIGTDFSGNKAVGNAMAGIYIQVPGNTIGGLTAGLGNVISGNGQNGIFVSGASNNLIEGNYIGTDITGEVAVGNGFAGITINNAPATMVGGTNAGARNVVSGNLDTGINLYAGTAGTTIQGNYVGTDATGDNAVTNWDSNIYLDGSGTNIIGGSAPGAGNLISATVSTPFSDYQADGIYVGGPGANGNIIQGNFIGTKADGISQLGNGGHGIEFANTASNNTVGGKTAAADNHIAFAQTVGYDGVRVRAGCLGNFINRNSIFSNAGWGIVVGATGVTISNLPVLTEAVSGGGTTAIQGSMTNYASGPFLIQFYANVTPNPSGYGEGMTCLGSTNITGGAAKFVLTLPASVPPGNYISATATDSANTTWEFGPDAVVVYPPPFSISQSGAQTILVTNPVTHVVTTNNLPPAITAMWPTNPAGFVLLSATNLSLPVAWSDATNTVSTNGATSDITLVPGGFMTFYRLLFQ